MEVVVVGILVAVVASIIVFKSIKASEKKGAQFEGQENHIVFSGDFEQGLNNIERFIIPEIRSMAVSFAIERGPDGPGSFKTTVSLSDLVRAADIVFKKYTQVVNN